MILNQRPLRTIYDTLLLTNSTQLLMLFFGVQKILFPTDDFRFLFRKKNYNPLLLPCPPMSHPTSCTPTKCNLYLANSLAAVSEPALYGLLTFHVPILMSLFHCLSPTKVSVQVRGKCSCFITKPIFTVRSC